jgi:hypothetical protein
MYDPQANGYWRIAFKRLAINATLPSPTNRPLTNTITEENRPAKLHRGAHTKLSEQGTHPSSRDP